MVFEQLASITAPIFAPFFKLSPIIAVSIFSVFLTGIITIINKLMINKKKMKEIKDSMASVRENLTRAQKEGNAEETKKYFNEYMKSNSQYMKQTFKTLMVSMAIVILFLPLLSVKYKDVVVAVLPFSLPFIGSELSWIWWYILVSFTVGWVIKKIVGE